MCLLPPPPFPLLLPLTHPPSLQFDLDGLDAAEDDAAAADGGDEDDDRIDLRQRRRSTNGRAGAAGAQRGGPVFEPPPNMVGATLHIAYWCVSGLLRAAAPISLQSLTSTPPPQPLKSSG